MKQRTHTFVRVLRGALWVAIATIAGGAFLALPSIDSLSAYVLERHQSTGNWKALTADDLTTGMTIPAGMHTFFTVPSAVERIDRDVLLGGRGYTVRYWGYCFPEEDKPGNLPQSVGFPGKIFLSEAERQWRQQQEARQNKFSPFRLAVQKPRMHAAADPIRHQLDRFTGGMTCYVMTQKELPIGTDDDGDGMNGKLEQQYKTDPENADTDGDGLSDTKEVQGGTNPNERDGDGDGLIDGIEDKNHNGRADFGETDPRNADSDHDGLPDGLGHVGNTHKVCKDNNAVQCVTVNMGMEIGEDKNLNGEVDSGESDPRKLDSVGDGVQDDMRFYKCLLEGKTDC